METLPRLAAPHLQAVVVAYRDLLRAHQEVINRLNVYPVPDGDTGTNMALTLESVVAELGALPPAGADMASVCRAVSHGSLMGARGNSGVILSQILRGIAEGCRGLDSAGPEDLADCLVRASQQADGAVMKPVEGTILTVARAAADGAEGAASAGALLVDVLDAGRVAAVDALARTPEQLPVLATAGVVDAGGAGFCLLLDAFLHVAAGRPLPDVLPLPEWCQVVVGGHGPLDLSSSGPAGDGLDAVAAEAHAHGGDDISGLRYEVMYLLDAHDETIPAFRDVWAGIGDSIVVVGGDGLWNCHIHTDDIGSAVEAGIQSGRPHKIRVTDLLEQVQEERWVREAPPEPVPDDSAERPVTGVVAVATGDGIRRIFHSLRVHRVVPGGQSMNPSTADLVAAIDAVAADQVVVLPNNKNIVPVAEQAAAVSAKAVRVVPTKGIAEGFAALLAYDPQASVDDNVGRMRQAAARVTSGEVTRAVRPSDSPAGPIAAGDWMGLSRSGIEVVAPTLADATTGLLSALLTAEHEIVTLIEGEGASPATTRAVSEWVAEHHPGLEIEIHAGGQPLYPYLLSIE